MPISKNVHFRPTAWSIFFPKWVGRHSYLTSYSFMLNIISTLFIFIFSFFFFIWIRLLAFFQLIYQVIYQAFRFHFVRCKWLGVHIRSRHRKLSGKVWKPLVNWLRSRNVLGCDLIFCCTGPTDPNFR